MGSVAHKGQALAGARDSGSEGSVSITRTPIPVPRPQAAIPALGSLQMSFKDSFGKVINAILIDCS